MPTKIYIVTTILKDTHGWLLFSKVVAKMRKIAHPQ